MGDMCLACFNKHFPEPRDYELIDPPDFDDSGLKYLAKKKS